MSFFNWYIRMSPRWEIMRQQVWARANKHNGGKCELCRLRSGCDVHHLTYERLGDEDLRDLLLVCRPCHRVLSGKRQPDDPTLREIKRFLETFDPKILGFDENPTDEPHTS